MGFLLLPGPCRRRRAAAAPPLLRVLSGVRERQAADWRSLVRVEWNCRNFTSSLYFRK
jgi:hypothetical protein